MSHNTSPFLIFWKKPLREKVFLFRIFWMLCITKFVNFILPFKAYSRFLGQINSESSKNPKNIDWEYVDRVANSIRNISKVSPFHFKCLIQASVGKYFIAQESMESTLYFGVKKDESQNLKAHAWLRVGTKIVLGGEIADQYNVVSMYS